MYKQKYFGHKDTMKTIENEATKMGLKFAYRLGSLCSEMRDLLIIANDETEIAELNFRVFGV